MSLAKGAPRGIAALAAPPKVSVRLVPGISALASSIRNTRAAPMASGPVP